MYDSNNDNNTGNNGLLSKFKLRLRLIRINRYKKVKNIKKEDEDNKKSICLPFERVIHFIISKY